MNPGESSKQIDLPEDGEYYICVEALDVWDNCASQKLTVERHLDGPFMEWWDAPASALMRMCACVPGTRAGRVRRRRLRGCRRRPGADQPKSQDSPQDGAGETRDAGANPGPPMPGAEPLIRLRRRIHRYLPSVVYPRFLISRGFWMLSW